MKEIYDAELDDLVYTPYHLMTDENFERLKQLDASLYEAKRKEGLLIERREEINDLMDTPFYYMNDTKLKRLFELDPEAHQKKITSMNKQRALLDF
ncbi:hypothetical protein [Bacillus toyonensis]|uniref:hypothetical protein n=1 Tax=Bacillus toyonensis TaxID=155322 RepID=UPI002E1A9283|nr:hypothetical protein [Bacillus toyonensis]